MYSTEKTQVIVNFSDNKKPVGYPMANLVFRASLCVYAWKGGITELITDFASLRVGNAHFLLVSSYGFLCLATFAY